MGGTAKKNLQIIKRNKNKNKVAKKRYESKHGFRREEEEILKAEGTEWKWTFHSNN